MKVIEEHYPTWVNKWSKEQWKQYKRLKQGYVYSEFQKMMYAEIQKCTDWSIYPERNCYVCYCFHEKKTKEYMRFYMDFKVFYTEFDAMEYCDELNGWTWTADRLTKLSDSRLVFMSLIPVNFLKMLYELRPLEFR